MYTILVNSDLLQHMLLPFHSLGIFSSNRSLILQLISQIRIGMDLTRFGLPIFIFEKRSLLEFYSEFFSHPSILLRLVVVRILSIMNWVYRGWLTHAVTSIITIPHDLFGNPMYRYPTHWTDCVILRCDSLVDPKERIAEVVKWLILSLSVSRKVSNSTYP